MLNKDTIRAYMNREVQIYLTHGHIIQGILKPIMNEIVNLLPLSEDTKTLGVGIASFHIDDIVAIRQINKQVAQAPVVQKQPPPAVSKTYILEEETKTENSKVAENLLKEATKKSSEPTYDDLKKELAELKKLADTLPRNEKTKEQSNVKEK